MVHCETPLVVSRLDSIKQFGPEENQLFDGTSIQTRFLYDLFVPSRRLAAVGALALALWASIPRIGEAGESGEAPAEGGTASEAAGGADWEGLLASGAVKTVQRGDTSITFQSGGSAAASFALSGTAARPSPEEALEALKPWRRLGRLKPEPSDRAYVLPEAAYRLSLYTRPELCFRLGDRLEVRDGSGRVFRCRASDSFRYPSHCVTVLEVLEAEDRTHVRREAL